MRRNRLAAAAALVLLLLLQGCAGSLGPMLAELDGRWTSVELEQVPFHSQVTDQCGPASLASVLNASGVAVTPEELKRRVYLPERQGALQLELIAATRHYGRIPYELEPSLGSLVQELDAGRPVLVLQNLGFNLAPVWHYAVVVGYDADSARFVLRSGDRPRHALAAKKFARTWARGDFWAMVSLRPGEVPANADPSAYIRSLAAAESAGNLTDAITAWRAATERWPGERLAWLGLGNALYRAGDLPATQFALERAVAIEADDPVVLNNLAQVYLELGCPGIALTTIDRALAAAGEASTLTPQLLETRGEAAAADSSTCQTSGDRHR